MVVQVKYFFRIKKIFQLFILLDSCDTEKEEEMVEYISNNDLITLGWIHVYISKINFVFFINSFFLFRHIQLKRHFYQVLIFIHIYHIKC